MISSDYAAAKKPGLRRSATPPISAWISEYQPARPANMTYRQQLISVDDKRNPRRYGKLDILSIQDVVSRRDYFATAVLLEEE